MTSVPGRHTESFQLLLRPYLLRVLDRFDPHLFPFPEDDMGYLNAKGLFVTLNLHDASGVNSWDAMFDKLTEFTGKGGAINKITDKTVPMNLVNATVTCT